MIKAKYILTGLLALATGTIAYGQDLLSQVPEQADFVTVINNRAIVKHSSFEKINEVLTKLGVFDEINSKKDFPVQSITDLGLSYDRNTYIYKTTTDSSYYVGILLPLKEGTKVPEKLFPNLIKLPSQGTYERRKVKDGKTQVAWNDNTLFILTGDYRTYYFNQPEVSERYGIEEISYAADAAAAVADSTFAYDIAPPQLPLNELNESPAATEIVDSVATEWEAHDFGADSTVVAVDSSVVVDIATDYTGEADIAEDIEDVDSIIDTVYMDSTTADNYYENSYDVNDGYSDSYYDQQKATEAKNDSIRDQAFANWLEADFDRFLMPSVNAKKNKKIQQFDNDKTLVHAWVKDLDEVYRNALPYDILGKAFGFNWKELDYGYRDAILDFSQDKHALKLTGSIGLDKDIQPLFEGMYKNKMNRKFAKYIPENHLGYFAVNINTEAYLKSLPAIIDRWYTPFAYSYGEVVNLATTALAIALDEKAISKVIHGDHVVFITDVKKVKTDYVDYEYDDNYNYKEVKKTKDEQIPTFLWMFTSEDQRIFEKIFKIAEKENKASLEDGIYTARENGQSIPFHILFKEDMVFVSNDKEQLKDIKNNRFKNSKNAYVKKQLFSNAASAVLHTSAIPETINKLEIPVVDGWGKQISELSQFGDVTFKANGVKKGRITGEMSINFPAKENNALQYLLQYINNNISSPKRDF